MKLVLGRKVYNLNVLLYSVLFIFSFQIFYTTKDFPILFYSTRLLFPLLAITLTFFWVCSMLINKEKIPYAFTLLFIFFFLVVMNGVVGIINFNQPFFYGVTAEFKLLSVFYFFLILYVFILTNATRQEITKSLIYLALFSFSVYYFFNFAFDPQQYYKPDSELIYFDYNKGYRYKFRTIFGVIAIFFFFRLYLKSRRLKHFLFVLFFISYIMFFSKGRFELLTILITMFLAAGEDRSLSSKALWLIVCFVCITMVLTLVPHFSSLLEADDNSGSIRLVSLATVFASFSSNPENLIFGFGYLNPLFKSDYNSVFGESFFVADIGWIGLIFEFGFLGASMFVYFYIILIKESGIKSMAAQPYIQVALKDFVIKTIMVSVLTPSIPYLWGIYASILAIFVYLNYFKNPDHEDMAMMVKA